MCLILLVFVVYVGFLQIGCLELLLNEIWIGNFILSIIVNNA